MLSILALKTVKVALVSGISFIPSGFLFTNQRYAPVVYIDGTINLVAITEDFN